MRSKCAPAAPRARAASRQSLASTTRQDGDDQPFGKADKTRAGTRLESGWNPACHGTRAPINGESYQAGSTKSAIASLKVTSMRSPGVRAAAKARIPGSTGTVTASPSGRISAASNVAGL